MNAAHVMTTEVITLKNEKNVKEGIALLIKKRIRQIPIIDKDNRIIGVVKSQKLLQLILPKYVADGLLEDVKFAPDLPQIYEKAKALEDKEVKDVLDKDFIKVTPDTSVFELAALFINAERPVETIYVVDDKDILLGIITPWDIFEKIWDMGNSH